MEKVGVGAAETLLIELIKPRGSWKICDQVETPTLVYVDWYNHRRLHSGGANLPPGACETLLHPGRITDRRSANPTQPASTNPTRFRWVRDGGAGAICGRDGAGARGVGRGGAGSASARGLGRGGAGGAGAAVQVRAVSGAACRRCGRGDAGAGGEGAAVIERFG
ncbi:hypothetical protein OWR29_40035 [Actinoplanes sp. Pm04-4]|uniref:Integrase catalytic domain-containing protein n=1 Tax=Paractinoplanes pyxinae TaxID=2997416 RepID=A0ABT4BEH2_9ACTN|nr:hypothetical protein [Actinoplanes pyxinae]MCY1144220.1 hypothetical protein [Actinoplanes pyxinae]